MYLIVIDARSSCAAGTYYITKEAETRFGALRFHVEFMRHIRQSYAHRQRHPYTIYRIAEKSSTRVEP